MQEKDLFKKISSIINHNETRFKLLLITRHIKDGIPSNAKVLDKYKFITHDIDTDEGMNTFFKEIANEQIKKAFESEDRTIAEYEVIDDDLGDKLYSYALNNAMAFSEVVNTQISQERQGKIESLKEVHKDLWAYVLRYTTFEDKVFLFRKSSQGKIASEKSRSLRSIFDKTTSRLKPIDDEMMSFDKKLDCIYYNNRFLIIHKNQFERLVGIEEEFSRISQDVIESIKATNLIEGIQHLEEEITKSIALLKRMSSIAKKQTHLAITPELVNRMIITAEKLGDNKLSITEEGKVLISSLGEAKTFVNLLNDYYKQGLTTGNYYGTNSGHLIK